MGNAASEMQHIANQLQGVGAEEKRFIQAVFEGKVEEAKAQLAKSPNVIYGRTRDWYNAWHIAAKAGNMEMLEMLAAHIKSGQVRKPIPGEPHVYNVRSRKGETPLIVACQEGHMEVMNFLILQGAGILDIDTYGNTCIHYLAYHGHVKMLDTMLSRSDATGNGDKSKRFTDLRNESGLMPLHFAVWGGKRDAARALIAAKCRLNATCHSDSLGLVTCNAGSTALHMAAMRGNLEMATFLLEMWATMNSQAGRKKPVKDPRTLPDTYGYTPLQIAQNLLSPSLKRDTAGGGSSAAAAAMRQLLKLLEPITRIDAPQRDLEEFEKMRTFIKSQSLRRSDSSYRPSGDNVPVAITTAPLPVLLSADGSHRLEIVSEAPSEGLGAEVLARRKAAEQAEAERRAQDNKAAAEKASENRAAAAKEAGLPPPKYVCPITLAVMDEPVTAADGNNYERTALEMWLELGNDEFPGNGVKIEDKAFTVNEELKKEIKEWRNFKL